MGTEFLCPVAYLLVAYQANWIWFGQTVLFRASANPVKDGKQQQVIRFFTDKPIIFWLSRG